jgi:D-alanine--poly(phosphoribitol) ligase subunit 2
MTDQTTLQTEVTALLTCALQVDVASVDEDLIESGLLDSLKIVELLVVLESRFVMTIPFEDLELESFRSVANIARLIVSLYASADLMNSPVSVAGAMRLPVVD